MYSNSESGLQSTEPDQIKSCVCFSGVSKLNVRYPTSKLMLDFDSTVILGTDSAPCINSSLLLLIDLCFNNTIFLLKTDTNDLDFTCIAAGGLITEITLLPKLMSRWLNALGYLIRFDLQLFMTSFCLFCLWIFEMLSNETLMPTNGTILHKNGSILHKMA